MPKEKNQNYAGFGMRGLAAIIDLLVLISFQMVFTFFFPSSLGGIFSMVFFLGYPALMVFYYQATLGKMALGLKIVSQDGRKLEIFQVLLREWTGKFLSFIFFFLGFAWLIFDRRKQSWHDKLARTLVVKK